MSFFRKCNRLKSIFGILFVVALTLNSSCSKREYHKYLSVSREFSGFSLLVRVMGTYHRHEKVLVGDPYRLFISVRPNVDGDFQVLNIVLSDLNKNCVLNITNPEMNRETNLKTSSDYFLFFEKTGLDLEYKEYELTFDVEKDGVLLEKINLCLEKDYSEKRMSRWWEDASSI